MGKWKLTLRGTIVLTAALAAACGGPNSVPPNRSLPGTVVTFGTDAPLCDVESFSVTITSASLMAENGGQSEPLITSTEPATVDFARLTDFTNILTVASVTQPGLYNQLQMTLTNPQLIVLNTSTSPPAPQNVPVTLTTTTVTVPISPVLTVAAATTSALTMNFNLRSSLQVNTSGQVTGTIDPQITLAANTPAGSVLGEATALYGVVQGLSSSVPSDFTGSFGLTLNDGTGQTLTVLANSSTVFEGDGVTGFSNLTAGTFVEVDAVVNTSGQVVAQIVDAEEQVSATNQTSAFLGKIIALTQDSSGNATAFTLLVDDEVPALASVVPLHSTLAVTLANTTNYFTNWQYLNAQGFTFGPQMLGVAQKVAVFGTLGSGSSPMMTASQVFLRPRSVLGNFNALKVTGSDGVTGGFTMVPCGGLFAGNAITVLTYSETVFTGVTGLQGLTPSPTLDSAGLLFYQQKTGQSKTGVQWYAPTWIMEARGVHQLPN